MDNVRPHLSSSYTTERMIFAKRTCLRRQRMQRQALLRKHTALHQESPRSAQDAGYEIVPVARY